jgi:hypothetical protein
MSSPGFRTALKSLLAASWSNCPVLDMSDWITPGQVPAGLTEAFLALQFIGGSERIATIGPIEHHSWREDGTTWLHLAFPTGEDSTRALDWGQQLVDLLRGKRIGNQFTIDYLEHFTDQAGAAIRLDGRWHGWSAPLGYAVTVCT